MADNTRRRGLANADMQTRQRVAHQGGQASPTKFQKGDPRARAAGQKGGQARAKDQDVKSGQLGRQGAAARWGKDQSTDE